MILDSLLAGTILFTSFAMRTPNIQPNPDDYEFSLGFSNQFYHLNRQWERELGNNYIDDILWFKYESKFYGNVECDIFFSYNYNFLLFIK